MTFCIYMGVFLFGIVVDRLWLKFVQEDLDILRTEARHLCDRLDKMITEVRQKNASV